eukprot:357083_1
MGCLGSKTLYSLNIKIINAKNVDIKGQHNEAFVEIEINGNKKKSETAANRSDTIFNQTVCFDGKTLGKKIIFRYYELDQRIKLYELDFVGKCILTKNELPTQYEKSQRFTLQLCDKNGNPNKGFLTIELYYMKIE